MDSQQVDDGDTAFQRINSRLRPDQLKPGEVAVSQNGRMDVDGAWQVRKGISVFGTPITSGTRVAEPGQAIRLVLDHRGSLGNQTRAPEPPYPGGLDLYAHPTRSGQPLGRFSEITRTVGVFPSESWLWATKVTVSSSFLKNRTPQI